jgi:hypothetical protein
LSQILPYRASPDCLECALALHFFPRIDSRFLLPKSGRCLI